MAYLLLYFVTCPITLSGVVAAICCNYQFGVDIRRLTKSWKWIAPRCNVVYCGFYINKWRLSFMI